LESPTRAEDLLSIHLHVGEALSRAQNAGLLGNEHAIAWPAMLVRAHFELLESDADEAAFNVIEESGRRLGLSGLYERIKRHVCERACFDEQGMDPSWEDCDSDWDFVVDTTKYGLPDAHQAAKVAALLYAAAEGSLNERGACIRDHELALCRRLLRNGVIRFKASQLAASKKQAEFAQQFKITREKLISSEARLETTRARLKQAQDKVEKLRARLAPKKKTWRERKITRLLLKLIGRGSS
jgi:hypothetical protein